MKPRHRPGLFFKRIEIVEVRSGSITTELGLSDEVRSTPVSDRIADFTDRQLCANRRHRACAPLHSFLSEDLKVNTPFLVGERYGRLSSRRSTVDMLRLL